MYWSVYCIFYNLITKYSFAYLFCQDKSLLFLALKTLIDKDSKREFINEKNRNHHYTSLLNIYLLLDWLRLQSLHLFLCMCGVSEFVSSEIDCIPTDAKNICACISRKILCLQFSCVLVHSLSILKGRWVCMCIRRKKKNESSDYL